MITEHSTSLSVCLATQQALPVFQPAVHRAHLNIYKYKFVALLGVAAVLVSARISCLEPVNTDAMPTVHSMVLPGSCTSCGSDGGKQKV